MESACLKFRCIECCLNTEMPLSNSDIARIRDLGFSENFFVLKRRGERQLKNSMGKCVFHNGDICTVYRDRPEGCRIYPVVFDPHKGEAVLDPECPHLGEFEVTSSISLELLEQLQRLDTEKARRLRSRR